MDRAKAKLIIELVCNHVPKFSWTQSVLDRHKINQQDLATLRYRGGVWPGEFAVTMKDGSEFIKPFTQTWNNDVRQHGPLGCQKCILGFEHGDVAVADPWGIEKPYTEGLGKTMVHVRTKKVMDLINDYDGIDIEPISENLWNSILHQLLTVKVKRIKASEQ